MSLTNKRKTSWKMRLLEWILWKKKNKDFQSDNFAENMIRVAKKMQQDDPQSVIPKWVLRRFEISKKIYRGFPCYFLKPKQQLVTNYLIYFHGGAYFLPIMGFQWNFIARLGWLTNSVICVPMYPLAPDYYFKDVPAVLEDFYRDLCRENQNELDVNIIGDSAGGGIALSFAQMVRNLNLVKAKRVILLSPSVDMTPMTKEEEVSAKELDQIDCMLSLKLVDLVVDLWCRKDDYRHYFASPIYGGLNNLNEIWLFTGTNDLLNLVSKRFAVQAKKENVPIHYIEREHLPHVWMFFLKTKEARAELKNLVKIITRSAKECIIS